MDPPSWYNALVVILQERGLQHEAAYLANLSEQGINVMSREKGRTHEQALDWTRQAMQSGAQAIVQASLQRGEWNGYADVLKRIDTPSKLGNWSYEVVDTKLASETRGGTILQLSLYSELVGEIQGLLPERMYVVKPGNDYEPESFRTKDYWAYYRFVKRRIELAVKSEPCAADVPDPVEQCEICQWWPKCNDERRAADHLSFVAGILKLQMADLRRHDIATLAALGQTALPLPFKPSRGSIDGYIKAREQARIQLESRTAKKFIFETLTPELDRGFARLPAPSPGDIFFDLESDPFVEPDELEYLFGYVTVDEGKDPEYHAAWAFDRSCEKHAFESFVDMVSERRRQFPDMHVYHFSPYEPGALKRLMGKHVSREDEIDSMLRAGVLVDLHLVVRQGMRAGVERYSLKDLEALHGFNRTTDLRDARTNLRRFEFALEMKDLPGLDPEVLTVVESYNREDCLSTLQLRNWLETVRQSLLDAGHDIARPVPQSGDASEEVAASRVLSLDLMSKLLKGIPEDPAAHDPEQRAQWLLANMMEWHRREDKAPWWEYFRLRELNDEQLLEERNAVAGLKFLERIGGTAKCPIDRYSFPSQDTQIHAGGKLKIAAGDLGSIEKLDRVARTLDIKKTQVMANLHPSAAFVHDSVPWKELAQSLHRIAAWVIQHSIDASGRYRAGRDLLLRSLPRRIAGADKPLYNVEKDTLDEARRLALELDFGVLPIQGPPGSGKTYTAARMICELVKQKKRVGVTAVGHKVIRKLLEEVIKAAAEESIPLQCIQKVAEKSKNADARIIETMKNETVLSALQSGEAQVAGGTAWLWARDEFLESVDVLFVDEAGQMSLADVVAVSAGGKSLVLLGDPQQLEQPLQGTHPPGLAVSALQHVIGDRETISSEAGLFLAETWRLAPAICDFTSELFYENRLDPRAGLEQQQINGPTKFAGSGLWFVPVEHEGNQNSCPEEVEAIVRVVEDLLQDGVSWTDMDGKSRPLQVQDILIVAPYNAQVFAIAEQLPESRVGTVDKFQGQEAAVVIYSMATSSREDAPRGMEFLYNVHRLNVATSRARCACVLIANPKLLEPECDTPGQMKLANALCRYAELAKTTDQPGPRRLKLVRTGWEASTEVS